MSDASSSLLTRLLFSWAAMIERARLGVIILLLLMTVALGYFAVTRIGVNTNTADMISPSLSWRQTYIHYKEQFPQYVDNMILVIEGTNGDAVAQIQGQLQKAIHEHPEHFESSFALETLDFFQNNGLLYLDLDRLNVMVKNTQTITPLMAFDAQKQLHFSHFFKQLSQEDTFKTLLTTPTLAQFFPQLHTSFLAIAKDQSDPLSWSDILNNTSQTHFRFILIKPKLNYATLVPAKAPYDKLQELLDDPAYQSARVKVGLTGEATLAYEELLSFSQGALWATILALLLVTTILYISLRSFYLMFASILTLCCGLIWTGAFATFAVGKLNLISVAFAVLYIGLGIDFSIHLCMRFKELIQHKLTPSLALKRALGDVGASLVICAITTCVGFYSFIPTSFDGVGELGLISGTGMLISLVANICLLPALLSYSKLRFDPSYQFNPNNWINQILKWPLTHRYLTRGVMVSLMIGALVLVFHINFTANPIQLMDPHQPSVKVYDHLMRHAPYSPAHLIRLHQEQKPLHDLKAELKTSPLVKDVLSLENFVPRQQNEKQRILTAMQEKIGPFMSSTPPKPQPDPLDTQIAQLRAFYKQVELQSPSYPELMPLNEVLTQLLARIESASTLEQARLIKRIEQHILAGLNERLKAFTSQRPQDVITIGHLPEALKDRWISPLGEQRLEIYPSENMNEEENLERFVRQVGFSLQEATGLPMIHEKAGQAVVQAFKEAFTYAFLIIGLLLIFILRSVKDMALVLFPLVLTSLFTGAATVIFEIPFNFANIIALPLLLGIGVDNGIHLVHRFRHAPPYDLNLLATSTAKGVLASTLTTIFSFINLGFSNHLGLASMGQLLTLGMCMTLMCTLIFLPNLLIKKVSTKDGHYPYLNES